MTIPKELQPMEVDDSHAGELCGCPNCERVKPYEHGVVWKGLCYENGQGKFKFYWMCSMKCVLECCTLDVMH